MQTAECKNVKGNSCKEQKEFVNVLNSFEIINFLVRG